MSGRRRALAGDELCIFGFGHHALSPGRPVAAEVVARLVVVVVVVVVVAGPAEVLELGEPTVGHRDVVVDFDVAADLAPSSVGQRAPDARSLFGAGGATVRFLRRRKGRS